jgi:uncharacterized protein (DUF2252 family)
MRSFAAMGHLAVWYSRIGTDDIAATLPPAVRRDFVRGTIRAKLRDHLHAVAKMTTAVDGAIRIVDDPPLVVHKSDEIVGKNLPILAQSYRSSIRDDLHALLDRYTFVDFAQKVVGVGSVGTRCYVVLMKGNGSEDPLFLQIKEAFPSVLEQFAGKSRFENHGQRVVRGQQYIQAASDIFLGWGRFNNTDFYVRQLRDMKMSIEVSRLSPDRLTLYASLCGWALARAHARSGDVARIAGYIGSSDTFDNAIVAFAIAYADQTERDHAALAAAVARGRIAAEMGR